MATKVDAGSIGERLAGRIRKLRAERGLSIEALAERSGVSRSMISLVERGESSPTAVILDKLASGLQVSLPSLFESGDDSSPAAPIARRAEQRTWRDPESGYLRRSVSPSGAPHPFRMSEIRFPAGGRVAFESGPRAAAIPQQIWVLSGVIEVAYGGERHRLDAGDCLAMEVDGPVHFHNPGRRSARYVVVTAESAGGGPA